jgi:nicotinate-nucleotide adenylyltransferase
MDLSSPGEAAALSGKRAFLGGSFDPVHLGHLGMAAAARESAELDEVIFMPCFVSPFKQETVATSVDRVEMLRIAQAELKMDWASVSTFEVERSGPSFSWETAEHFSNLYPAVDWHWILGTDQWEAIDRWAEPGKLRELLQFVVVTRDGDAVRERKGWRYRSVSFSHPASSTMIREDFAGHENWLPDGVAAYCRERGLYQ